MDRRDRQGGRFDILGGLQAVSDFETRDGFTGPCGGRGWLDERNTILITAGCSVIGDSIKGHFR